VAAIERFRLFGTMLITGRCVFLLAYPTNPVQNVAGAIMSPIRIAREVHQGWLSGNGIACKCRVELATKISPGFPTVRTLDIWIPERPPEGHYKVQIDGTTLDVHFKRGLWQEAVA